MTQPQRDSVAISGGTSDAFPLEVPDAEDAEHAVIPSMEQVTSRT
jgi:hypothetical protein